MDIKVFNIGMHKTGTTSFQSAMRILGYSGNIHWNNGGEYVLNKYINSEFDDIKSFVDKHQTFSDVPWFLFYKKLKQWYPSSKFILTYRDSESWFESLFKHSRVYRNTLARKTIYGKSDVDIKDKQFYIDHFDNFNTEVKNFFKNDHNFLSLDISTDYEWETICPFLNKNIPNTPFPHKYKTKK